MIQYGASLTFEKAHFSVCRNVYVNTFTTEFFPEIGSCLEAMVDGIQRDDEDALEALPD